MKALFARGQPLRLRWVEYVPEMCPLPSQPGIGHDSSSLLCLGEPVTDAAMEEVGVLGDAGDLNSKSSSYNTRESKYKCIYMYDVKNRL